MARTGRSWIRIGVALLASLAGLAACGRGPSSETARPRWVMRDLLKELRVEAGGTMPLVDWLRPTRGSWVPKCGSGVYEEEVFDGEAHRLTTMLRGPMARTIQVPVPEHFEASRIILRAIARGTGDAFIDASWVGETTAKLTRQPIVGREAIEDVVLEVPPVVSPELLLLELGGSAEVIGVMRIYMERPRGGGDVVDPILRGPLTDRRRAIALAPGSRLAADIALPEGEGPGYEAFDVIATVLCETQGERQDVTLTTAIGGQVVETSKLSADDARWRSVRVHVPPGARTCRFAVETDAAGSEVLLSEVRLVSRSERAPTVLLVTSDTHRGDHLGTIGNGVVWTPVLDALAGRGVQFTNCFSSTNITNPSHIALMTGTHVRDTRIANNTTALGLSATTLAEVFREHGYRTFAATSVMHLTRTQSGLGQGFDRYNAPDDGKRDGRAAIAQLLEWLPDAEDHATFVWLHVYDAHAPYDPPEELVARHYASDRDPRDPAKSLGAPDEVIGPWIHQRGYRDPEYLDARYRAAVDYVDLSLTDLLGLPRMKDAVLAFTADHGESLGRDRVFWEHSHLNIATLHIPLILAWPGCTPQQVGAPVEQIDVGRTLLELSGITAEFPGESLLGALDPNRPRKPRYGLGGHGWNASIESDGWLLTLQIERYPRAMGTHEWEPGEVELFDLRNDPEGLTSVLEAEFSRAKKLRAALIRWLEQAPSTGLGQSIVLSPEARASLEALGYGGGTEGVATGSWWKVPPHLPWVKRFAGS